MLTFGSVYSMTIFVSNKVLKHIMQKRNLLLHEKLRFVIVIILIVTITGCTGASVKETPVSAKTNNESLVQDETGAIEDSESLWELTKYYIFNKNPNKSKKQDNTIFVETTDGAEELNGLNIQGKYQEDITIADSDRAVFEKESRASTIGSGYTDGGEIGNIEKEDSDDTSQENEFKEIVLDKTSMSVGQIEHPYNLFPEYRIKPGDLLDVLYQMRTWTKKDKFKIAIDHTVSVKFVHSPELNETQIIRPDGNITLPYLGEVSPVGMTVVEFTNLLKKNYANILKNPEIYVTIPEFQRNIKELKADLHTAPRGLSRLVTVRPDGQATFAMIGHLDVAGRTVPKVNKELNKLYDEMMPGLHCDLFLEKHSGSVIYVVGEVKLPGAYNIIKPISVLEAIALAGSHIPGAKLSSVIIARRNEDKVIATRLNLKKVLTLKEKSKFFYLQPDDIVYVPRTFIKTAADVMNDIASIFMFRGWGANLSFTYELKEANTSGRNNAAVTPSP
jgi:polysaccharide export outer membrane protein